MRIAPISQVLFSLFALTACSKFIPASKPNHQKIVSKNTEEIVNRLMSAPDSSSREVVASEVRARAARSEINTVQFWDLMVFRANKFQRLEAADRKIVTDLHNMDCEEKSYTAFAKFLLHSKEIPNNVIAQERACQLPLSSEYRYFVAQHFLAALPPADSKTNGDLYSFIRSEQYWDKYNGLEFQFFQFGVNHLIWAREASSSIEDFNDDIIQKLIEDASENNLDISELFKHAQVNNPSLIKHLALNKTDTLKIWIDGGHSVRGPLLSVAENDNELKDFFYFTEGLADLKKSINDSESLFKFYWRGIENTKYQKAATLRIEELFEDYNARSLLLNLSGQETVKLIGLFLDHNLGIEKLKAIFSYLTLNKHHYLLSIELIKNKLLNDSSFDQFLNAAGPDKALMLLEQIPSDDLSKLPSHTLENRIIQITKRFMDLAQNLDDSEKSVFHFYFEISREIERAFDRSEFDVEFRVLNSVETAILTSPALNLESFLRFLKIEKEVPMAAWLAFRIVRTLDLPRQELIPFNSAILNFRRYVSSRYLDVSFSLMGIFLEENPANKLDLAKKYCKKLERLEVWTRNKIETHISKSFVFEPRCFLLSGPETLEAKSIKMGVHTVILSDSDLKIKASSATLEGFIGFEQKNFHPKTSKVARDPSKDAIAFPFVMGFYIEKDGEFEKGMYFLPLHLIFKDAEPGDSLVKGTVLLQGFSGPDLVLEISELKTLPEFVSLGGPGQCAPEPQSGGLECSSYFETQKFQEFFKDRTSILQDLSEVVRGESLKLLIRPTVLRLRQLLDQAYRKTTEDQERIQAYVPHQYLDALSNDQKERIASLAKGAGMNVEDFLKSRVLPKAYDLVLNAIKDHQGDEYVVLPFFKGGIFIAPGSNAGAKLPDAPDGEAGRIVR